MTEQDKYTRWLMGEAKQGRMSRREFLGRRADGTCFPCVLCATIMQHAGRQSIIATLQDRADILVGNAVLFRTIVGQQERQEAALVRLIELLRAAYGP